MSTWKFLLPMAALVAIGLAISGWASRPAEADIQTVTASSAVPAVGTPVTITVSLTNMAVGQTVTLNASTGIFSAGASGSGTVSGANTTFLTFFSNATGAATFTGTYTCATPGVPVTFFASQTGAAAPSGQTTITCSTATATGVTVTPASASLNQQVQVTGTCLAGGQQLVASGAAFGNSPAPTNGIVVAPQIVQCNAAGQMIAYFYCSTTGNITFTLAGAVGNLSCGTGGAGGIVATPPSVPVNQTSQISGNCAGSQLVTSSAGGQFQGVVSGASYTSPNSITCAGGVFVATFLCGPAPATITFTSGLLTGTLGCGTAAGTGLTLNPPSAGTTTSVTGQCTVPGTQLTSSGPGAFVSASMNGANIPGVQGSPVISCSQVGTLTGVFNCTAPGAVTFNLAGIVGAFTCTAPGQGSCLPPAVLNPATGQCTGGTGGTAATITVSANPSSLQCTGSSSVAFISVAVKDAAGQAVLAGTNVTITADSGTFAPSQATTDQGGGTQFIYSPASTSSGTVTIRANAGSAQGTATVNVSCNQTTAPPPSAPVTSPPPPPSGPVVISPPNTGDAGLATSSDSNWQLYAAAIILVAATAGTVAAVVRAKA